MDPAPILWALPVAALLLALGWRPWSGQGAPRSGPFASALAVPACLIAGWYGFHDAWPALEPAQAKDWLPLAVAAGALGVAAPRHLVVQAFLAWVAATLVVGAGLGQVLSRQHGAQAPWIELGLEAALAAYALSLAGLVRREGFEVPLLGLIGLVAAATVQRGGYASGALLLAAVGCAVGGGVVLGLWRRGWRPLLGAGLALGIAAGGVLVLGARLAESPARASVAAALVPQAGWIPARGRWGIALRIAAALGLAAAAHLLSAPPPDPYG